MKRVLVLLALAIFSGSILIPAAVASNHKFPDCHGKNSVPCRPDPQPSHGKDCLKHGKGGINEDHCAGVTPSPTPTPTPTSTPPVPTPTPTGHPKPGPQDCSHISCLGGGGPLAKTGLPGSEIALIALVGFWFLLLGIGLVGAHRDHTRLNRH